MLFRTTYHDHRCGAPPNPCVVSLIRYEARGFQNIRESLNAKKEMNTVNVNAMLEASSSKMLLSFKL